MSKVTSKLQVTIPKRVADHYGIRPGDEIEWQEAGDTIRVQPVGKTTDHQDVEFRLKLFDSATRRQRRRQRGRVARKPPRDRGWQR